MRKTANVLDKLPKSKQPEAKGMFNEIYEADTRKEAEKEIDCFVALYEVKYPKTAECLAKDRHCMLVLML